MSVAGNVGVFCHYDEEYEYLTEVRKKLTEPSSDPNKKYFLLHKPITIPAEGDVPGATYTHLYIRKPDIYRAQVGDIDFILEEPTYSETKSSLLNGVEIKGARIFHEAT